MAVAMGDVPQSASSVAFDVSLEPLSPSFLLPLGSHMPAKFADRLSRRKKALTSEQLEEKLRLAERRRRDQENGRLDRIHERQKHCQTMAHKMALLMEQDAKRRNEAGTEEIPTMSKRQAAAMVKSVAQDFQKIGISLVKEHDMEVGEPSKP